MKRRADVFTPWTVWSRTKIMSSCCTRCRIGCGLYSIVTLISLYSTNKQTNISLLFILGWGREGGRNEGAVTQSLHLNALWLSAAADHPDLLWLKALLV